MAHMVKTGFNHQHIVKQWDLTMEKLDSTQWTVEEFCVFSDQTDP